MQTTQIFLPDLEGAGVEEGLGSNDGEGVSRNDGDEV